MKQTAAPWELVELAKTGDGALDGGLGHYLIRAKGAPGGIAITVGGLGDEEEGNARLIVKAANEYPETLTLAGVLLCNLEYEHVEAMGDNHFTDVANETIGCSVCSLIKRAKNFFEKAAK